MIDVPIANELCQYIVLSWSKGQVANLNCFLSAVFPLLVLVQVRDLINFRPAVRNAGAGGYVPPGETPVSRVSPAKKKDLRRRSAAPREGRGGVKKSTPPINKHAPSPAERLARCVHVVECPGACSQPRPCILCLRRPQAL